MPASASWQNVIGNALADIPTGHEQTQTHISQFMCIVCYTRTGNWELCK